MPVGLGRSGYLFTCLEFELTGQVIKRLKAEITAQTPPSIQDVVPRQHRVQHPRPRPVHLGEGLGAHQGVCRHRRRPHGSRNRTGETDVINGFPFEAEVGCLGQVGAQTGHNVTLVDVSEDVLNKSKARIGKSMAQVAKKKFKDDQKAGEVFTASAMANLTFATR